MGKLSKLLLLGLGVYSVKYYLDNPNKKEEHKELVKEKIDNSIGYTKCMWNYTKKNGVVASAEYLKNDFIKVVDRNKEKLSVKVDNTVEFGKQLVDDVANIKDNGINVKEKGLELKANITEATKVLKEEITPNINSYVSNVLNSVSNLTEKVSEVKETIKDDNVTEKVNEYKESVNEAVDSAKETIEKVKQDFKK